MMISSKIYKGIVAGLMGLCLMACTDREQKSYGEGAVPLGTTQLQLADVTYNSLTFKWEPVSGAVEYSYKLTDKKGTLVDGGMLSNDSVKIENLSYSTDYVFYLYAYAAVESNQTTSQEMKMEAATPFYPAIETEGTFYSSLVSGSTQWTDSLVEERETGKDSEYGTFTLKNWYNHEGYDLQFSVNSDSTITILNGTLDEESGFVNVQAGPNTIKTNVNVRKGCLINEKACLFDWEGRTLKLAVRSTKDATKEGEDEFDW